MEGLESYWTKRRKIAASVEKAVASVSDMSSCHCPPNLTISAYGIPFQEAANNVSYEQGYDHSIGDTCSNSDPVDDTYAVFCDDVGDYVEFDDTEASSSSDSDDTSEDVIVHDINFELSCWAKKYDISQNSLSALLDILRPHFYQLPKDPRTLLKTARTEEIDPFVKRLSGGEYYHFGVAEEVTKQLVYYRFKATNDSSVSVQINVDGVPLFKSTGGQFWPVLGKMDAPFVTDPFVIGIFYGVKKPANLDFLNDVIDECCELKQRGIVYGNFCLDFCISVVVCDAPARAFLKNIKGHTAYSACERCVQSGVWNGKMTYPDVDAEIRTDKSFDEMKDPDHHHGQSPLAVLGIGMVTQFVLDYMHLVCLGVVRRLIWLWISGPVATRCRLGANCITSISERLISLRSFLPCEFSRKPRSLSDWQRWKATEFRQFLLYTGPVALLGKLSDTAYKNFMLLSVGIFVLLDKTSSAVDIDYAQQLLVLFVQHFSQLYGSDMLVFNVHNLIHLADDARRYGPLDSISAFCFENFLGQLVKLVRKPSRPLQQVVRRILERKDMCPSIFKATAAFVVKPQDEHCGYVPRILGICKQYKRITIRGSCISLKPGNNCITLEENVVIVCNIVVKGGDTLLLVKKFSTQQSFFSYPWESSRFRIYQVSGLQSTMSVGKLDEFRSKNVLLPLQSSETYVAIPLIHL